MAVATATTSGGDDDARLVRDRARGGDELEEESEVDLRGKAQGPRGRAGEWRGGLEASRGCRPYPLSDGDGDRVRWRPASAVAGSGEQGGGRRPGERWAAGLGHPDEPASWAIWPSERGG